MRNKQKNGYQLTFLYKPGKSMDDDALRALQRELQGVAVTCFDHLPTYQCLATGRAALEDKVLTLARRPDGRLAGFCSAVLLPVVGVGEVLHLGLTCVHPMGRGHGLTHKLTSRLLLQYLARYRPIGKQWISNVACVLSSLGNVALNFDQVFPSPYGDATPSKTHKKIGAAIDAYYRPHMAINQDASFCPHSFVFRGSVTDTVFQKQPDDTQYHHRKPFLNRFYMELIDFAGGDEVLQVGHVSLLSLARYFLRRGERLPVTAAGEILARS